MITVYGRPDSSAVARLMWTICELDLPHKRIDAGGSFGGLDEPAYLAMNPAGAIPSVVLADGRTLWESNAIIRYLCAEHSLGGLCPADAVMRAQAEAWMDWASAFGRAVGAIRHAYRAKGATMGDGLAAVDVAALVIAILDHRLADGRSFVMGEALTIADLSLGVIAHRLTRCPEGLNTARFGAIFAWYARLALRPAFQTHVVACVSAGPQRVGG